MLTTKKLSIAIKPFYDMVVFQNWSKKRYI